MATLLISENRVKKLTGLDENITSDQLSNFILQAQDLIVQSVLSTRFFKHIKEAVVAGTLTDDEKELLNNYIGPVLAHYSFYYALPSLNYKAKNKSVLKGTSEEAVNVDLTEFKILRSSVLVTAEFYESRLREFLCDFSHLFPLYLNNDGIGMPASGNQDSSTGLFIPKKNRKSWPN